MVPVGWRLRLRLLLFLELVSPFSGLLDVVTSRIGRGEVRVGGSSWNRVFRFCSVVLSDLETRVGIQLDDLLGVTECLWHWSHAGIGRF